MENLEMFFSGSEVDTLGTDILSIIMKFNSLRSDGLNARLDKEKFISELDVDEEIFTFIIQNYSSLDSGLKLYLDSLQVSSTADSRKILYGLADGDIKISVDPLESEYRIGSIRVYGYDKYPESSENFTPLLDAEEVESGTFRQFGYWTADLFLNSQSIENDPNMLKRVLGNSRIEILK